MDPHPRRFYFKSCARFDDGFIARMLALDEYYVIIDESTCNFFARENDSCHWYSWASPERISRDCMSFCLLVKLLYCYFEKKLQNLGRACLISGCALAELHCTDIMRILHPPSMARWSVVCPSIKKSFFPLSLSLFIPADGPKDKASYTVACPQLKSIE